MKRGALGLALLLSTVCFACEDGIPGFDPRNTSPTILESFGVQFADYDPLTGMAGDFIFDPSLDKPLVEFGNNNATPDGVEVSRTWEFRLAPGTPIVAPLGAEVADVIYRAETDDHDIVLMQRSNSPWSVIVHHVNAVLVGKGDQVSVGSALGEAGNLSATVGRTELQVVRDEESFCPFELLREETDLEARVSQLLADWETFRQDDTIYTEASQPRPACAATSYDGP